MIVLLALSILPVAVSAKEKPHRDVPKPWRTLALAIDDLGNTFGKDYPNARAYRDRLAALEKSYHVLAKPDVNSFKSQFDQLHREALLANPREYMAKLRSGGGCTILMYSPR